MGKQRYTTEEVIHTLREPVVVTFGERYGCISVRRLGLSMEIGWYGWWGWGGGGRPRVTGN